MKELLASLLPYLRHTSAIGSPAPAGICPRSIHFVAGAVVAMGRDEKSRFLLVLANGENKLPAGFVGEPVKLDTNECGLVCPLTAENAAALRRHFSWCSPKSLRGERTSIGCGDRLGLATAGQLRAARKYRLAPVLAQQSMRELTMTKRTFRQVVDDAAFMVFSEDYREGYGADGDHLKNIPDIDTALDAGMPMITLDLSEVMNAAAGEWSDAEVEKAFDELPEEERQSALAGYADQNYVLDGEKVAISAADARRCAVMYDKALKFAEEVHKHLQQRRGEEFDLEISIDETTTPTLPAHHLYIARELMIRGVTVTSIAPRFVGEFQKAVDYIGDVAEFARQFKVHARIARAFGNYKISVHSGSDKFAVYPTVGEETQGFLHLKTAGTSWLVAVEVIAEHDPELYRAMHRYAEAHFTEMLKLYHITADLSRTPPLDSLRDDQLPELIRNHPDARQLLHITYGPILTGELRERFFSAMHKYEDAYAEALEKHFDKHFTLLGIPRKD